MRLIYVNGYNDEDRAEFKSIIYHNVVSSMKALIKACEERQLQIESEHQVKIQNWPKFAGFSN
jgi:hypothetical protein